MRWYILFWSLVLFHGAKSQSLHAKSFEALLENCYDSESCSQFHRLKSLYEVREYDSAYLLLNRVLKKFDENSTSVFHLKIIKARLLLKKKFISESLRIYEEAVLIRDNLNIKGFIIEPIAASIHIRKKSYLRAIRILKSVINQKDILQNPKAYKSCLHNLGIAYLHSKSYDSADLYLNRSIQLKKDIQDTLGLAISYMDVANLYYQQYLDDKAIPLFIKGLEYAKLANDPQVLSNAYLNMAVVEENRKDLKKSLAFRKKYEEIQKELWDRDKVWELAEKEKKFEVERKENEIAVQEAQLESQQWQLNTYLLVAISLLIIAGASGWSYRKVKQSNVKIYEQKQELEALNETKNRLFSVVAHDLKSPVVSLQDAQKRLAKAIEEKDNVQVESILLENEGLVNGTYKLLNNTLQWALDQSGQLHFNKERISLKRLVEMVVYDYQTFISARAIHLNMDLANDSLVEVDVQSLKTCVRNILDNAIKFTPKGGRINIALVLLNDKVSLKISDSGCGMNELQLAKLFEVNGSKIQRDQSGNTGTGLGMILCKSLIEKNNGTMVITSKVGEGTAVKIGLPLVKQDVV